MVVFSDFLMPISESPPCIQLTGSTIGRPLTLELHDSVLDLHGWLSFTTDIEYWIANRIYFEFQNQSLAFIIKGDNFVLDGNDKGGIDGNGQAWYDYAEDAGNVFGRYVTIGGSELKKDRCRSLSPMPRMWSSRSFPLSNLNSGLVSSSSLRMS